MTDVQLEMRRQLRERAFQALMSLEYERNVIEACRFAYTYDKDSTSDSDVEIPTFLLNLVMGVEQSKSELDEKIRLDFRTSDVSRKKYSSIGIV